MSLTLRPLLFAAALTLYSTTALAGDLVPGESVTLQLDSRVVFPGSNATFLDLDCGCYDMTTIRPTDPYFLVWAPWGGAVTGCNADGGQCTTGWYMAFHTKSPEWGLQTHNQSAGSFYKTPELAFLSAPGGEICLSYAQRVPFGIWDGWWGDNWGGVTVVVTQRNGCDSDCPPGSEYVAGACVDVDECATSAADCDTNATCTNADPGWTCACNPGFTGTGQVCTAAEVTIDTCLEIVPDSSSGKRTVNKYAQTPAIICGSAELDVREIDLTSVVVEAPDFEGGHLAATGQGAIKGIVHDTNGDGYPDMRIFIFTAALPGTPDSGDADVVISGATFGGTTFHAATVWSHGNEIHVE